MSSDCVSGRVVPCQRRCCWLYFARSRADASATRNGLYKRRISRKQTPKLVLFTASSPALRNFLNVAWLGIRIAKPPLWRLRATIQVDRNRSRSTIELVKPSSEFPLFVLSALRRRCQARERAGLLWRFVVSRWIPAFAGMTQSGQSTYSAPSPGA